jgi:LCP family protein required for cell wall assembly
LSPDDVPEEPLVEASHESAQSDPLSESGEAPIEVGEPPVETAEAPIESAEGPSQPPAETAEAPIESAEGPTEPPAETAEALIESAEGPATGPEAAVPVEGAAAVPLADAEPAPEFQPRRQKDLRKARRKAKRRKHRWRRRMLYALSFIIFVAAAGAGGIYFYARYRFDEIPKIHSKHLVKQAAKPGQPFNVLLVGSDSRAFVNNPTQIKAFGDDADAGGQRSDVTMVARFVPATKTVTVISIPRDLWVNIPENSSDISGMNRINAAFNSGPDLLIQTIEDDLHIPINHYISVGFPGFLGMVNSLGGVTMDFPTAVKDAYTGLDVTTLGCQVINGTTSLQLVRARHLEYINKDGHWEYDGLSDFSRIQRQDSFFRAVLAKVNTSITNPLAINDFISAAVGNLAIDDTLTEGDLFHIATEFRGLQSSHLVTETLPTTSYVTGGGADVLLAAQPYATQMVDAFNQLGVPQPKPSTTTTTTAPPLKNSAVSVDVLNASGAGLLATDTADGLRHNGFLISGINNAPSVLPAGEPSEIYYGPTGLAAAHTLADSLKGKVSYVPDASLTGNNVTLWVANAELTVIPSAGSTTTTTVPTTPPGDVYTNTQPEYWNPVPCTLGAPATTTTATTTKVAKHNTTPTTAKAAAVKTSG